MHTPNYAALVPLDYTYVLYDPSSHPVGPLLALLTLSPFFLFSSYATIILVNRPLSGFNILLGQLSNEALNGVLKRRWKGIRPGKLGDGYGMPSSHSQFLGYSSTFLIVHLLLIHQREQGTGRALAVRNTFTAKVTRYGLVVGLVAWSLLTGYSRVYLHYHTAGQVILGLSIGSLTGLAHALLTEVMPFYYPASLPGRIRSSVASMWTRWPIEGFGGFGPGSRRIEGKGDKTA
ncbi:hypothetical protein NliqN6_6773 [Naganishia liquefaciens]|uniref:Phosphatidic acid phosphatase type 2/haloperoxidase domain-containing protein n=1 Tax=Naganishia liquefaciens TaxID=104408 RepID=A0A8H3YKB3_9TREE|nr:hypothetical protein NliqN6_6773 [Naganishia liquefaciens]